LKRSPIRGLRSSQRFGWRIFWNASSDSGRGIFWRPRKWSRVAKLTSTTCVTVPRKRRARFFADCLGSGKRSQTVCCCSLTNGWMLSLSMYGWAECSTKPVYLLHLTRRGEIVSRLAVPTNLLTTSFSSKSEMAIQLSTEGTALTFMGYVAGSLTIPVI